MALQSRSITYNDRLTTTADKIYKSGAMQDAISNSNPTFAELYSKGKIKEMTVGGEQLMFNIMYQLPTTKSYSRSEKLSIGQKEAFTRGYVPWCQYADDLTIDGLTEFQNMGKEQIIDLVSSKAQNLTAGFAETINADMWDLAGISASHPYSGNSGKQIIPIPIWVQEDPTNDNYDIANIDQSVETWWQNQYLDGDGATTDSLWKSTMSSLYNDCSQGPGGKPDLIVMNQACWEVYEATMQDQIRYAGTDKATAGFGDLYYKPGTKVVWDGYVPDPEAGVNGALAGGAVANNTMYFLNTNSLTLYVGKGKDFKPRGFQSPVDQDASTSLYIAYMQLVCTNRRKNGVLFDLPLISGVTI